MVKPGSVWGDLRALREFVDTAPTVELREACAAIMKGLEGDARGLANAPDTNQKEAQYAGTPEKKG